MRTLGGEREVLTPTRLLLGIGPYGQTGSYQRTDKRPCSFYSDVASSGPWSPLIAPEVFCKLREIRSLDKGAKGIESTNYMETKEFCGAAWPSKELKRKERNS